MSKRKTAKTKIAACGYLRKSNQADNLEQSISNQKKRIGKLLPTVENAEYVIVEWFTDPGVQGWKRNHRRPAYFKMVNRLRDRKDFEAVLVDDADRFSRADPMETVADVQQLRELGLRFLHSCSQGCKDLVEGGAMIAMQIAMEANASHEHCTRLSRRISEVRRNKAEEGLRSGGRAPYALKGDGAMTAGKWKSNGLLVHGDAQEIKTVKMIYDWFANKQRSMTWIAGELNRRKIPSPKSDTWFVKTIGVILKCSAYPGDFTYGLNPHGEFYRLNEKGDVVRKNKLNGERGKVYREKNKYSKPIIPRNLFNKAQARLEVLKTDRSRRKRGVYSLAGVLVCGHCGSKMHGFTKPNGKRKYRCASYSLRGKDTCTQYEVWEHEILPFVLQKLAKGMEDIRTMLTTLPDEVQEPWKERSEQRAHLERERDRLTKQIQGAGRNLLAASPENLPMLDKLVSELRTKLEKAASELESSTTHEGYTAEELERFDQSVAEFYKSAVGLPVSGKLPVEFDKKLWNQSFSNIAVIDNTGDRERLLDAEEMRWRRELHYTLILS